MNNPLIPQDMPPSANGHGQPQPIPQVVVQLVNGQILASWQAIDPRGAVMLLQAAMEQIWLQAPDRPQPPGIPPLIEALQAHAVVAKILQAAIPPGVKPTTEQAAASVQLAQEGQIPPAPQFKPRRTG
jgi:hypothetical protein